MDEKNIKDMSKEEILRRQLELLAEASTQCEPDELCNLTAQMIELVKCGV